MKDTLKITGKVNIVVKDKNGNIKEEKNINNLVVDAGKDFIASRIQSSGSTVMSHMAVGTGNTTPASNDTTLETELDRNAFDSATVTNNEVTYVTTYAAGDATGALTEAGIFNAASAGTMLCRTVFPTVNKDVADSLTITWTVSVG